MKPRHCLVFLFVMLHAFLANAQNFDWVRTVNGNLMDECLDVVVSRNTGYIYSTGYFTASADFLTGPDSLIAESFHNCAYVSKYNPNGELIWLKTLATPNGKSKGNGIAIDSDDDVIVVGGYEGTVDFNPSDTAEVSLTTANFDPFIWKLDQDGNYEWVERLFCSYTALAFGVATDTSDNIVFSGQFTGTITMFGDFAFSDNNNRGFICKLDSNGDYLWANELADVPGDCYPNRVRSDAENSFYVAGSYLVSSSPAIGFLQKVLNDGSDGWRVELGNPSGVGSISDVSCSPNGLIVCGSFKNQAIIGNVAGSHFVYSNGNFYDAVVFKLNANNGSPIWSTVFGSSGNDYATAIDSDENGNIYVAGRFQGTVNYANIPQATITANGTDVYLWKLGYDGEGIGGYSLTNPVTDNIGAYAVCTAIDGAIYIGGSSYGVTDFDHDLVDIEEHSSLGYGDGYLHRTTDCDAFLQPQAEEIFFCQGDSVEVGGLFYHQPQLILSEPVVSQWGCDSIASVQLLYHPYAAYEYFEMCHGDSVLLSSGYVFESGEYVTEFTSSNGCDSSFYEIVSWIPSYHSYENYVLCQGSELTIYDQVITEGGEYQFLFENTETTCMDTITVTIDFIAINSGVTQQGNSLIVENTADSYLWKNCNTGLEIAGATSYQFFPDLSGSYAVTITRDVCSITSLCVDIEIVGVDEIAGYDVELFPNPAQNECYLHSKSQPIGAIDIIDISGRLLYSVSNERDATGRYIIPLKNLSPGVYTLVILMHDQTKLIKKIEVN